MEPLDQMIMWGYRVEQSQEVEGVPIWFIEGDGFSTYVRGDDTEALQGLVDSHDERVKQANETPEETMQRLQEEST